MTVVLCHCSNRHRLDPARLETVRQAVLARGDRLFDVADACHAAVQGDAALAAALGSAEAVFCGCHVRALEALAVRLCGTLSPTLRMIDLRDDPVPPELGATGPAAAGTTGEPGPPAPQEAVPDAWYPLIDARRCSRCGRCASFCLFGVYARAADGLVQVANPLNCKTDCPACARICPEVAIIFPKCPDPAINGAPQTPEQLAVARVRLDPKEVVGGDLRAKLAARRAAAGKPMGPLYRQGAFGAPDPSAASREPRP